MVVCLVLIGGSGFSVVIRFFPHVYRFFWVLIDGELIGCRVRGGFILWILIF